MTEYDRFTGEQKEKHRIQTLILKELYGIAEKMVFKGGTALAFVYGLDRFSEDLDFATDIDGTASIDEAIENLDSRVIHVENDWGNEIRRHSNMYVYLLDFYSELISTRLTIKIDAIFEKCLLPSRRKTINFGGNPVTMHVMDEEEIMAEKINAIMNEKRNQPRDLYDLRFLLSNDIPINLHLVYLKSQSSVFGKSEKYSIKNFTSRVKSLESKWGELKPYLRELPAFSSTAEYVINRLKAVS